jgi:transcription elongation factor Elf1
MKRGEILSIEQIIGYVALGITVYLVNLFFKNNPYSEKDKDAGTAFGQGLDRNMICPHCQTKGSVTTRLVKKKVGIHGGKATAALLTSGISLLGSGLSRKDKVTEAHCNRCGATWYL